METRMFIYYVLCMLVESRTTRWHREKRQREMAAAVMGLDAAAAATVIEGWASCRR